MNHIVHLIPTLDRLAGAERQALLLATGLRDRGWRVSIVTLSGCGDAAKPELPPDIRLTSLGMRKGLADPHGWARWIGWVRRERPDVIHTHLPHAAFLARWSRAAVPIRGVVDTLHTTATGPLLRRLGYRISSRLTDHVTAVSQGVAEANLSARLVHPLRITVIPNAVDVHRWRPDAQMRAAVRARAGWNDEFLWLAAGRLDPVKDYPALLWAMMEVPFNARLAIAGAGPDEEKLRRLACEYGLETRVRFLGFKRDVRSWMQAADAFVLSSRWEGLPMSLLEAGACGLPCVATDVPGSGEVILPGETGYLASPRNGAALRAAMARMMLLSAEDRAAMGHRARARVAGEFSLDRVLDQWESLYRIQLALHPVSSRLGSFSLETTED